MVTQEHGASLSVEGKRNKKHAHSRMSSLYRVLTLGEVEGKKSYIPKTKLHRHSSLFLTNWNSSNQLLCKGIVIWWATAKSHFQLHIYLNRQTYQHRQVECYSDIASMWCYIRVRPLVNYMHRTTLIKFISSNDGTVNSTISAWQRHKNSTENPLGLKSPNAAF